MEELREAYKLKISLAHSYVKMYSCSSCGKTFTRCDNLQRHMKVSCKGKQITMKNTLRDISNNLRGEQPPAKKCKKDEQPSVSDSVVCDCCNKVVRMNKMNSHRRTLQHKTNACVPLSDGIEIIQSAFECRIVSYRVSCKSRHTDYVLFFDEIKPKLFSLLTNILSTHLIIKVNMELFGRYILPVQELMDIKSFNTTNEVLDQSTDLTYVIDMFIDKMISQTSEFQECDSGWALESILFVEVNVNKFSPLGGSSYIKLPEVIERKHAIVNVHNNDQCCFAWAVTSALHPANFRTTETSSYPHYSEVLNVTGMNFPMKLKDIPKFEQINNISINVYGLESKFDKNRTVYEIVGPLYYSQRKLYRHVNLLLITSECGNSHYCWIKNMSRLISSQLSKHGHKKYICDGCLQYFNHEQQLLKHQEQDCNHIYTITPSQELRVDRFGGLVPGNILKFENFHKKMEVPFVIYADFESVLQPMHTCEPNPRQSYTNRSFVHNPYSFAYLIKCSFDDSLSKFEIYRGKDAAKIFVAKLENDIKEIYKKYLKPIVPMNPLSKEEEQEFINASICGICEKPFQEGCEKVRDHCHLTGKKRFGAAHSICNLNYKIPHFIPIIFHNLSGYDCHLFIKELCSKESKVDVVAQSKEKYISFGKFLHVDSYADKQGILKRVYVKLRFIDSFKFMASSLQNLGDNLHSDQFLEMRKFYPEDEKFELMRQKGVFPYSFVDDLCKLDNTELPSKEDFYDNLNEEHITDKDYERAVKVWNIFNCRNLGDYSDIYLKSDVLLLCDVFENFRKICLDIYKLDPAQYMTAPSLAWDAMLKLTNVELELLTDIDMIHLLKRGIRGGISQCSERKHIANNIFLPNYDPKESSSFITYLDATNLYGHSMSQFLPTGGFEWLSFDEIKHLDILNIPDDNHKGYILEVDVHYPPELHDLHSDLPFLAECIIPPKSNSKISKLVPNLNDKFKYVSHYRTLKQALKHGLILTKIHRVLKFNQSPWLKKYIDLNTEMRNKAKNKFEKDFFKLLNNSVFGKTMENVDKRQDIKLVTHWEKNGRSIGAKELISLPNFKSCSVFSEDFVAIHLANLKVTYDKPIYVGFSILDLSKTVLYGFFYDVIKKEYGANAGLLYTDTDSLIIKIYTDNFYSFMKENLDKFDTSNYRMDNTFNMPITMSIVGKMKDEFPEDPILSFYGTGAKAYYVKSLNSEMKKAKGVKKSVIRKQLSIDDYINIVEKGGLIFRKMSTFKSDLHTIYTDIKNKVALSYNDDKRFIIPNTTKTLAWGHSDITFYQTDPKENVKLLIMAMKDLNKASTNQNLDDLIAAIDMIEGCKFST